MEADSYRRSEPLLPVVTRQVAQLLDLYLVRLEHKESYGSYLTFSNPTWPWLMYVRLGSPYLVAMLVGAARMYWNLLHYDGWMIFIILDRWMIFVFFCLPSITCCLNHHPLQQELCQNPAQPSFHAWHSVETPPALPQMVDK